MRDTQVFFDVLSFPTDFDPATGSGVIIDGPNGEIRIYHLGVLVGRWNSNDFRIISFTNDGTIILDPIGAGIPRILLDPADGPTVGNYDPGAIFATAQPSDETPFTSIVAPAIPGQSRPQIALFARNNTFPGAPPEPRILLIPNSLNGTGGFVEVVDNIGDKTADFRIHGVSIGRGKVNTQKLTGNSVGYSADGATDMLLNNQPVIAGREYRIWLHTKYLLSAAGQWSVGCHINGTRIGEFDIISEGAGTTKILDGQVLWNPVVTASTDDITVELDEFGGASTLTLQASADAPRWLKLEDTGI